MKETEADRAVRRAAMENSGTRLHAIVLRLETLAEQKAIIADQTKQTFAEAKTDGYDAKAIRVVLRRRAEDDAARSARQDLESVVSTYLDALEAAGDEN